MCKSITPEPTKRQLGLVIGGERFRELGYQGGLGSAWRVTRRVCDFLPFSPKTVFTQAAADFCLINKPETETLMRYTPTACPKCGTALASSPKGGRPSRWCCEGCKRSGEAEMARLQTQLRSFEEGRWVHLLNYDEVPARRQRVIAEMQARYDQLAGVPERTS
jgi:hypothetical protein